VSRTVGDLDWKSVEVSFLQGGKKVVWDRLGTARIFLKRRRGGRTRTPYLVGVGGACKLFG